MWIFDKDMWIEIMNTLTKNLFRTFLTMLGVFIAMIILLLLLGATAGLTNGFNDIFAGTTTNSLFVFGGSTSEPYKGFERGRTISFTTDDVELIKKQIPEIDVMAPRVGLGGGVQVYRNGQSSGSSVNGDYPEIDDVTKKRIVRGRFLNQNDINETRKVCVIGQEAYEILFETNEDPLGQSVRVNGVYFTVVGVFKKNERIDIDGENVVFVPFTTFQKTFGSGNRVGFMAMTIFPEYKVPPVEEKIKEILKRKYSINPIDDRAIGTFDLSQIFEGISVFTTALKWFSIFIGGFTLLAGVIAVSNILLITVKERTKEIGVRRALGATPIIVKRQIIMEAIVITVFAGILGFAFSVGVLAIADTILSGMEDIPVKKPIFGTAEFIGSFVLMIGLSILIGLIPANRAVRIKPIDALREE